MSTDTPHESEPAVIELAPGVYWMGQVVSGVRSWPCTGPPAVPCVDVQCPVHGDEWVAPREES